MHFTYVIFGIFLFINTLQLKAESQNISSEWVQAQSYISSWKTSKKSQPLFSINETGHFRPYTVENDKLKPIFDDKITKDIQDYDLYSPKSLPSGNLVLVGAENGKKNFDIFVYHRQKRELVNITSSPEIDEGSVCVDSKEEQFLYHTERTGVLVKYDTKSGKIISVKLPLVSWKSCHWINNKEILIVGGRAKQYFSQHCMESPKGWKCDNLKILNQFDAIGDMSSSSQNEIFLHARKSNEQFRKPYRWNPKTDEFDTVPINFPVGDIASFSGTTYRVGLHSFFSFNASADHGKIVLFSQEIEGQTWGIIADGKHPKRPAQLRDGKWEYLAGLNDLNSKEVDILPQEVWIRSKKGKLYQAFLWSKEQPKQIVVWTHGGPTESVSPRFNPYFACRIACV